ncbi:LPXTG cell wall anchor domain-containing protein [Streptococcus oriscaviae]
MWKPRSASKLATSSERLPNTGESKSQTGLFGSLGLLAAAALIARRKRKNNQSED